MIITIGNIGKHIINIQEAILYEINGKLHNEYGPAVEYSCECCEMVIEAWFINDELHRDVEPAYIKFEHPRDDECTNKTLISTLAWCQHDKLHRDDAPAFISGHFQIEKSIDQTNVVFSVCPIHHNKQMWYKNGKIHRDGKVDGKVGPAVIEIAEDSITESWFIEDELYREVGPCVVKTGFGWREQFWYHDDELHNEDGPAVIAEFSNTKVSHWWYKAGKLHRDGSSNGKVNPAFEHFDYSVSDAPLTQEWFINGQRHREDGPAIIRATYDPLNCSYTYAHECWLNGVAVSGTNDFSV